jgi:hypothetical protein
MKKGWFFESARHSLARKGISTKIKTKWAKFKEKRQFEKEPIGKLTKFIEKLYKLGYTDKEIDDYFRAARIGEKYGISAGSPKEFLIGWRESGQREQEFKKMEQDLRRLDAMRAGFVSRTGRKPNEAEVDEMITKL